MGINLIKREFFSVSGLFPDGFRTPRLAVYPFAPSDVAGMETGFDSPSVWRFSRGIDSAASAGEWLLSTLEDATQATFTVRIRETDELAGFCVLLPFGKDRVEAGGWLSSQFWRRGLGRELLDALTQHTSDGKGHCPLVADVDPENKAACCLLASAGFVARGGLWTVDPVSGRGAIAT
ncbi:GNAT family N-acetyltransferase [Desulfoluna spongiiphila]|uniref:Protein N-acetyltransferase, RimJ/RimL family n=1 Tax=Desulfoluna spongiiphila TaxID=419481 RepID=A0A1G5DGN0_9BACT|nr:GNAT family N-acetyltransferase [Desulfoluna spongiiphila]SCY13707.1 Protein N-acetyltransferase, RimJ/RimL family [Desulfoluna spongiiphila]